MIIHTAEPDSTRENNERVVKILYNAYEKDDLDKVAVAAVQIDKINAKSYQVSSRNLIYCTEP